MEARKKFITKKALMLAVLMCMSYSLCLAGGWPMRPGRMLLSPSINYFYANKSWDSLGVKKPFNDNGRFTSLSFYLYGEYGISRRFTLVGSLPYLSNNYQQDNYKSANSGLGDLELGMRYYLANIKYIYYFSLQGTVITPLYTDPNLGYKKHGAEVKIAFSGSGKVIGKNYYFNLENGLRQYFGESGPFQDRYSGVFGLTIDRKMHDQISIGASGTFSRSSLKAFSTNLVSNQDFSFTQASLSYGHTFGSQFSTFVSANKFITGRNTGAGVSGSFSLIYKFDL
jgi:hypothetical protein